MDYRTVVDKVENIEKRSFNRSDFIDDFVNTKEKRYLLSRDILILADEDGWTVAHWMVCKFCLNYVR